MASTKARKLASAVNDTDTKMGDIKKRAKEIKKDHELAMGLWSIGGYYARLLATLILDKNLLTQDLIDQLAADMLEHEEDEGIGKISALVK